MTTNIRVALILLGSVNSPCPLVRRAMRSVVSLQEFTFV